MKRKILIAVIAVIAVISVIAVVSVSATNIETDNIQETETTTASEMTVEVQPEKLTLGVNGSEKLTCEVTETEENKKVKWTSENIKVATVKNGKVSGKALGKTTVTATADDISASCQVTVNSVSARTIIGKKLSLSDLVKNIKDYKKGSWKTSDKKIATVSSAGKLKEKSEGTCKITFTAKDKTKYTINVKVIRVSLNKTELKLFHKGSAQLKLKKAFGDVQWSTSDKKIAKVSSKGKVKAVKRGKATITATCYGVKFKCEVRVYGKKLIAITFDDGPSIYTNDVMDTFKKYDSSATFFVVGNRLSGNETTLKRMVKEGHEIGNHSWSHPQLTTLGSASLSKELKNTSQKIKSITGKKPVVLRPPYGSCNTQVKQKAKDLDMAVINWSVDTLDWKTRNKTSVANVIMNQADSGEIVLCHDLYYSTAESMKTVVPQLVAKGYDLVTVTELLESEGGKAQPGQVYFNR